MAMNKAEKAHVAALEKQLAEARSFRRTELLCPDIQPPGASARGMTFGFRPHTFDLHASAEPAASSSVNHYRYSLDGKRSVGSQRPIYLCSTRLLALQVARCEMEANMARALALLDAEIEAERANPTPHPEAA